MYGKTKAEKRKAVIGESVDALFWCSQCLPCGENTGTSNCKRKRLHVFPPSENVLSSYAWGCDGEFLHQLEQTVSDGIPASRAAPQHHKG